MISKPNVVAPSSSNVTKSTSALPTTTKNTSNKNDEVKIRDNKMKKTGSATIIADPKKRLMIDEAKGKVTNEGGRGEGERERGRRGEVSSYLLTCTTVTTLRRHY
jgi:hypothetical protein